VRWVTRYKTMGQISPSPSGGDRRSGRIEAQRDYLLGLIRRTPDITLLEIQERLIQNCGERFSVSVLWRFFDRHGVTFKKRPRTPRSSGVRTFWRSAGTGSPPNSILDPAKLVFVDETGASTSLARTHGRCRRGRRLRAAVPHGHYKTVTLVAGLRLRGLAAPRVYDRPMNAALFEERVEMSGSHPLARRYRRHGQFDCPQGSAGRTTHKIRRGRSLAA
jgi:hypothetical protein